MCRLTPANTKASTTDSASISKNKSYSFSFPRLWPLPLWLVIAAFPLLPTSCYLNQGYTKWFHWCSVAFLLTQNKTLCQFLAVQGLLICVGWYCSLSLDYIWNDRFMHILYRNMPSVIEKYILEGANITGQNILVLPSTTLSCLLGQLVACSLDLLLHPGLTYYFWRRCYKSSALPCSWNDIISWKILGAALVLSRLWSITHNWLHSNGKIQFYYFGTEVYNVAPDSEHLWMAAYVGETITTVGIVAGKLLIARKAKKQQQKQS